MSRIIKSLKQAIRHVKGDKTSGRSTIVVTESDRKRLLVSWTDE